MKHLAGSDKRFSADPSRLRHELFNETSHFKQGIFFSRHITMVFAIEFEFNTGISLFIQGFVVWVVRIRMIECLTNHLHIIFIVAELCQLMRGVKLCEQKPPASRT